MKQFLTFHHITKSKYLQYRNGKESFIISVLHKRNLEQGSGEIQSFGTKEEKQKPMELFEQKRIQPHIHKGWPNAQKLIIKAEEYKSLTTKAPKDGHPPYTYRTAEETKNDYSSGRA